MKFLALINAVAAIALFYVGGYFVVGRVSEPYGACLMVYTVLVCFLALRRAADFI